MYEFKEVEEGVKKFWKSKKIYAKAVEKNVKGKKFYFCDGPPYVTGTIHPGTAWNKCVKDAVCRFKRARGFKVRDQAGFDTHGLPIEVKVEQELKLKSKKEIEEKIGVTEFIEKCKHFATQYIGVMSEQFKSLGVWMDFENPYITYKDDYIERSWATVKAAHEKELLSRGVYVLPHCPRCETTMANYELEYDDKDDPSIYVKFKVKGKENEYLVVWTTTPWTLAANMAVMAHPTFVYVKVKVDGEQWIVAKERLDALMAVTHELGLSPVVVDECTGMKLKGLEYEQPLGEKIPFHEGKKHEVVLSDQFVTLEEGTGLVHCAPGHGPQDFIVGRQYGIEAFCPVGINGKYTEAAGEYAGMFVKDADKRIIKYLQEKGALIHSGTIRHRYAHCWRCKTPLVHVATDQWFIAVTKLKEKMREEIDKSTWQPEFARTWFKDFVSTAPDWCISRQRYWGIPLPIWICENKECGKIKVVGSKKELGKKIKELHKPFIDEVEFECEKCKSKMKRTPDVLDVWFDSGNAIWASLSEEEMKEWYPCDFIVEGKDQIRGWFYSLLGSGVVYNNEIPYKSLLMHGHFVDEKGEKMSKSMGNFVPLEEIIEKHGIDAFRLWSLSAVTWEDVKFLWDEIQEAQRVLSIYWNLCVFLQRFSKGEPEKKNIEYELEDQWLLSRLNSLVKKCTESLDAYAVHEAARVCREFIVEDLSRFYLKLGKKRLNEEKNAEAVQSVLYQAMLTLAKLTTPIVPFISEEVYQSFYKKFEKEESISLAHWPEAEHMRADPLLEKNMAIAQSISSAAANARNNVNIKLRWPLEEIVVVTNSSEVVSAVERLAYIIEGLANVKRTTIKQSMKAELEIKPLPSKIGPVFKNNAGKVKEELEKLNALEAKKTVEEKGEVEVKINGASIAVKKEFFEIKEKPVEGYSAAQFEHGTVYVKTEISKELYREALAREVARRIQIMRKEMQLVEKDSVEVNIVVKQEFASELEPSKDAIAKEVKAKELAISTKQEMKLKKGLKKKWEIEEEEVTIIVEKA